MLGHKPLGEEAVLWTKFIVPVLALYGLNTDPLTPGPDHEPEKFE